MNSYISLAEEPIEIGKSRFIVLSSKKEDMNSLGIKILRKLIQEKNRKGIYINSLFPYATIVKDLRTNDINPFNLYFIDMVPSEANDKPISVNLTSVGSLNELTEIMIFIPQILQLIPNLSFIYIDSLYELIDANGILIVRSFINVVKRICEEMGIMCICVLPNDIDEYKYIIEQLVDITDQILKT